MSTQVTRNVESSRNEGSCFLAPSLVAGWLLEWTQECSVVLGNLTVVCQTARESPREKGRGDEELIPWSALPVQC